MKVKVSYSLDNLLNENVATTADQHSDKLYELLEWLFATKNLNTSNTTAVNKTIHNTKYI